jgi:hypothetical protein
MKMTPDKIFICLFRLLPACNSSPEKDHPYTSGGLTIMLPPYCSITFTSDRKNSKENDAIVARMIRSLKKYGK